MIGISKLEPDYDRLVRRSRVPGSSPKLLRLGSVAVSVAFGCVSCSWVFSDEGAGEPDELPPLAIEIVAGDTIKLRSQYFETGSSDLNNEGMNYLRAASEELVRIYESGEYVGPICIEGHTDSRGDSTENQVLSQRRAVAVRNFMKSLDVENELTPVGKGESESDLVETFSEARRVDVRLESCDGVPDTAVSDSPATTVDGVPSLAKAGQGEQSAVE